ncbi:unnamed protein product [marine sediment metagenome]|uniref:Uncharacterized protein n=1 Tax=marine sediment metagenome TaxID=412755 RepID=X0YD45_9ZZZZ
MKHVCDIRDYMTDERWENLIFMVEEKFGVLKREKKRIEEGGGGEAESVEFDGPLGKMKIERISRPRILDKKVHYSRRIGSGSHVDYIYSDTEKVQQLKVYKWNLEQNDWEEVNADMFA